MDRTTIRRIAASAVLLAFVSACKPAAPKEDSVAAVPIAAGGNHTCTLEGGKAKCWGENTAGQLGDGTFEDRNSPVDVTMLPDEIAAVSAGFRDTCALTKGGSVMCWGADWTGRLDPGEPGGYRAVDAGGSKACVITAGGGVQCLVGYPESGVAEDSAGLLDALEDVNGLADGVRSVSVGVDFACAVQNGGVKCWGSNDSGQLGDGTYTSSSEPHEVAGLPAGVQEVAAGIFHACALTDKGEVWCWGENLAGELGNGTFANSPVPVKAEGLEGGVKAVAAGGGHSCALLASGAIRCWGNNSFGQLGDGTTDNRNAPVDAAGLSGGATAVAAGGYHTCAVLSGGAVQCWGWNKFGQLGNGNNQDSHAPVEVLRPG